MDHLKKARRKANESGWEDAEGGVFEKDHGLGKVLRDKLNIQYIIGCVTQCVKWVRKTVHTIGR